MGTSGRPLSETERLQILRAIAYLSPESDRHRELNDIAHQYDVSLTFVKRLTRDALTRAVAILDADQRLSELLGVVEYGPGR